MSESLHHSLFHISILCSFSVLVFSLFTGKDQSYITSLRSYLILAFSCDLTLLILAENGIHNLFVMPIYMIGTSIIVLIWMYRSQFNSVRTKLILTLAGSVLIIIQLTVLYLKKLTIVADIPYALLCIVCTVTCVYYYFITTNRSQKKYIREIPFFWINTGFLLYFGLTIIINMVFDYILTANLETYFLLWSIQIIATIILNIFIGIGLWSARQIDKENNNPVSYS